MVPFDHAETENSERSASSVGTQITSITHRRGEEMSETEIVKGYKATDKNMQCRGFQFEFGKWHKHNGEIAMCESGFHFCEYPSGPWAFYSGEGTRIFKVEARGVEKGIGPGADLKHVAMEIRLVEEIFPDGNMNTGDRNTGRMNTGHRNTGNRNTGHRNTGDGNATDKCAGYFCVKKQPIIMFDSQVKNESLIDWDIVDDLCDQLLSDKPFDYCRYTSLPNATVKKIKALHEAHILGRAKDKIK